MARVYLIALAVIASMFIVAAIPAAQIVGTASIHAPAVLLNNNTGTLTLINITVTNGTGDVSVVGPMRVGNSTNESAAIAARYAASLTGANFQDYNFTYDIMDSNANVSGPSAGAAMTMLAVSALSHRNLIDNFTMTGTIYPNGTIGQVGGVYDKAMAARSGGMSFIMVPWVQNGSVEMLDYILAERSIGIPLVQVSNITQAEYFAFSKRNVAANETIYNLTVDYNAAGAPNATLRCSNACNVSPFTELQNFTYAFTGSAASELASQQGFSDLGNETLANNAQALQLASKGYLYMAADIEFLNYVNSFMLLNHDTTISEGSSIINSTSDYCSSIVQAELTSSNYEYVIAAELRSAWGAYTINSVESAGLQQIDTDTLLDFLRSTAESQGWCAAAQLLYNQSSMIGGQPSAYGQSIRSMAESRIARASNYPGIYLSTAQSLYSDGQYGAAIIDADYAYIFSNPNIYQNISDSALNALSTSMAENSTYGEWATQFSNVALFYVYSSEASQNATIGHAYAMEAYQYAALASQISNDTANIYNGLVPTTSSTTVPVVASTTIPYSQTQAEGRGNVVNYGAMVIASAALVISAVGAFIASLAYSKVMKSTRPKGINRRRRER